MTDMFSDIKLTYVNGEFVPPEAARISVFDRGLIFGDGIYEVIPAYGGRLFRWSQHLERLNRNLGIMEIRSPLTRKEWEGVIARLTAANGNGDQYVYLQVTRGVAPRDHVYPEYTDPTVLAYAHHLPPVSERMLEQGVGVITVPDIRWHRCDIKTTSLIANVWLRQQASERDAVETLLVRNGVVTEGAAANVFAVIDGVVRTPPHGTDLLPGVTRDLIVELMEQNDIRFEERPFTKAEMCAAEEVWISSSTKEVLPVTRIDSATLANGCSGEVFQRVYKLFQECKADCRSGHGV